MIAVHVLDPQGYTLALFDSASEDAAARKVRPMLFCTDNVARLSDVERSRAFELRWHDGDLTWEQVGRQEVLF